MRKWKDNEGTGLPKNIKNTMLILAIPGLLFLPIDIFIFHNLGYADIFDFGGSAFLIWGIKFNGLYKIVRYFKERELRKKDNHWRNS